MHPYQQSTPFTAALVLASAVLVLAVSLTLITACLFMLTHLHPLRIAIPTAF